MDVRRRVRPPNLRESYDSAVSYGFSEKACDSPRVPVSQEILELRNQIAALKSETRHLTAQVEVLRRRRCFGSPGAGHGNARASRRPAGGSSAERGVRDHRALRPGPSLIPYLAYPSQCRVDPGPGVRTGSGEIRFRYGFCATAKPISSMLRGRAFEYPAPTSWNPESGMLSACRC